MHALPQAEENVVKYHLHIIKARAYRKLAVTLAEASFEVARSIDPLFLNDADRFMFEAGLKVESFLDRWSARFDKASEREQWRAKECL